MLNSKSSKNSNEKIISKGTVTFGLTQKVEDHEIPIKTRISIDLGVLRADTNTGSSSAERKKVEFKMTSDCENGIQMSMLSYVSQVVLSSICFLICGSTGLPPNATYKTSESYNVYQGNCSVL